MLNKSETQPCESTVPETIGLIPKLTAIITAALGIKIIEILTLTTYFYILSTYLKHNGTPAIAMSRVMQFIPIFVIYYLFWRCSCMFLSAGGGSLSKE